MTNAAIDIMYIDMQRKWDHMNPERTSGKIFIDMQRKWDHMNPEQTLGKIFIDMQRKWDHMNPERTLVRYLMYFGKNCYFYRIY